jgi:hypothetical protein
MTADSLTSVRELDCRWTNGIQVRLLWCQCVERDFGLGLEVASGPGNRKDESRVRP